MLNLRRRISGSGEGIIAAAVGLSGGFNNMHSGGDACLMENPEALRMRGI